MATFFQLKNKALKTIEGAYKLANELGYEAVAQNIEEILKNFRNKQLMVVAAGEARRGKSTMLNAVLNEGGPLWSGGKDPGLSGRWKGRNDHQGSDRKLCFRKGKS